MKKALHEISTNKKESAVLVAIDTGATGSWFPEDILDELNELAQTAGADVTKCFVQRRKKPDVAYYVGEGKAEEIREYCIDNSIDMIIFAEELSPGQKRNLEEKTETKIIDRTELILDVFAMRARSKEGKLQVELAQLNYLLPQLSGKGTVLSRLGGGIGTRGPGETKLETDRRHIRNRIHDIEQEIKELRKHRQLHRKSRRSIPLATIALVGYTNAGKSTFLNASTDAEVLAENKLFATLDPTTRQITLPNNHTVLLSDTVGFIHNLPHHLVAAFKATLEEVAEADILLHVVDVSHPKYPEQIEAVQNVLSQLDISDRKTFTALNKIDRLSFGERQIKKTKNIPDSYPISALTKEGIPELMRGISSYLDRERVTVFLRIPYDKGDVVSFIHNHGQVLLQKFEKDHTIIEAKIMRYEIDHVSPFIDSKFED